MSALPHHAVVTLVRAVDEQRAVIPARHLALVKRVCIQAVSVALSLPGPRTGMVARSAALLMLELASPRLDQTIRTELAGTCETVAIQLRRPSSHPQS